MPRYETILTNIGEDEDFLLLSHEAQRCWFLLRLSSRITLAGLIFASRPILERDLGLHGDAFDQVMEELTRERSYGKPPWFEWDPVSGVLWFRKKLKWEGDPSRSEARRKSVARDVALIGPDSRIRTMFEEEYPEWVQENESQRRKRKSRTVTRGSREGHETVRGGSFARASDPDPDPDPGSVPGVQESSAVDPSVPAVREPPAPDDSFQPHEDADSSWPTPSAQGADPAEEVLSLVQAHCPRFRPGDRDRQVAQELVAKHGPDAVRAGFWLGAVRAAEAGSEPRSMAYFREAVAEAALGGENYWQSVIPQGPRLLQEIREQQALQERLAAVAARATSEEPEMPE